MNILFITPNGMDDQQFGGNKSTYRNYSALSKIGNTMTYEIKKRSTKKYKAKTLHNLSHLVYCSECNNIMRKKSQIKTLIRNINIEDNKY